MKNKKKTIEKNLKMYELKKNNEKLLNLIILHTKK